MRPNTLAAATGLVAVCLLILAGCGRGQPAAERVDAGAHAHDHGHEGPHGGHIIELGSDRYHAELVHDDDSHRVGIYILDGTATKPAAIEAQSVTINVQVDGEARQYELAAVPQPSDPEGRSSYFEVVSEPLCDIVCGHAEADATHARLSLNIDGRAYVGIIETDHHHHHDHDHDH